MARSSSILLLAALALLLCIASVSSVSAAAPAAITDADFQATVVDGDKSWLIRAGYVLLLLLCVMNELLRV
jgi:hypothetical protein